MALKLEAEDSLPDGGGIVQRRGTPPEGPLTQGVLPGIGQSPFAAAAQQAAAGDGPAEGTFPGKEKIPQLLLQTV